MSLSTFALITNDWYTDYLGTQLSLLFPDSRVIKYRKVTPDIIDSVDRVLTRPSAYYLSKGVDKSKIRFILDGNERMDKMAEEEVFKKRVPCKALQTLPKSFVAYFPLKASFTPSLPHAVGVFSRDFHNDFDYLYQLCISNGWGYQSHFMNNPEMNYPKKHTLPNKAMPDRYREVSVVARLTPRNTDSLSCLEALSFGRVPVWVSGGGAVEDILQGTSAPVLTGINGVLTRVKRLMGTYKHLEETEAEFREKITPHLIGQGDFLSNSWLRFLE